jgi:hypothetical protein
LKAGTSSLMKRKKRGHAKAVMVVDGIDIRSG